MKKLLCLSLLALTACATRRLTTQPCKLFLISDNIPGGGDRWPEQQVSILSPH